MGAFVVAAAAAIGNLLQGWDGGAIAGALLYLKPEFHLEESPALEGEVVASTLVGAVAAVCIAGPSADWLGRKFMLCVSGVLYAIAALVMIWSPTVYILIVGRLLVGCAIGLAATIAPILISESAPSEIRGQLATFPQFLGSGGLFLAYVMDFVLSLQPTVNWRVMLGVLFVPAVLYVVLGLAVLPESPRWLVSKGRMSEAKKVLQSIRGQEDVDGEMALLVEGLGAGGETHIEEWLLKPAEKPVKDDDEESVIEEGQIKLFGPDDTTWIATPIVDEYGHSLVNALSTHSAMTDSRVSQFLDPVVTMMGSVQNSFHDMGLMSHDDVDEQHRWDEEAQTDLEQSLLSKHNMSRQNSKSRSPMSRQQSRRAHSRSGSRGFGFSRSFSRRSAAPDGGEFAAGSVGVGGGWQLAWRWDEGNKDGEEAGLKRVFLKNDGGEMSQQYQSTMSLPGIDPNVDESFQAAVIVGQSTQFSKELMEEHPVGPAMMHPAETATRVPPIGNLWDHGVKRALFVGVCLQFLQQFSGINAVLYFTPQILMQSGAGDILGKLGLDAQSSSILASGVTCFLMLPCIFLAMKLMDVSGRRGLLLATIPALTVSLVALVIVNLFSATGLIPALISFLCVTTFICSFVAGFGPIPNILCSEIFPTRVRGTCIGLCAGAMWSSNVIMTYSFPILNQNFGLQGVFGFFAVVTFVAWIFVFVYVPETKGQPLEVICEIFAMAARKDLDALAEEEY